MYYLYLFVITLFIPVELCRLYFKSIHTLANRNRLKGIFTLNPVDLSAEPVIWLHAVSVGEVVACTPLVFKLRKLYPNYQIVVTTVTVTGAELVHKNLKGKVTHQYLPYDHPVFVKRFLKRISPEILLVAETEIWPVLFKQCKGHDVPVIMINARLSDRSFNRYLKIAGLTGEALQNVEAIVSQSQANADRFKQLVSDPGKISINKNLKFDAIEQYVPDSNLQNLNKLVNGRQVIFAASTHHGEERILVDAFKKINQPRGDYFYLLAPRHPERAGEVMNIATTAGFIPVHYSNEESWNSKSNMLIVDCIGVLKQLFQISDVVIMGGSFVPVGGHNMLEPAMASKAIITGPYVDNFREIYDLLLTAGGIRMASDGADLSMEILELLKNSALRQEMGKHAREVITQNQGGTEDVLKIINKFLISPG